MHKEHIKLSQADQDFLMTIIAKGQLPARVFRRATALLELNRGKTLCAVAETLQVSYPTVAQWRDNYQACGLQALADKQRTGRPVLIDGKSRAAITALACSTPPVGRARWTLRLLADKVVELGYCQSLSHTKARSILKKLSPTASEEDLVHRDYGFNLHRPHGTDTLPLCFAVCGTISRCLFRRATLLFDWRPGGRAGDESRSAQA